jgi:hypothetical protein
VETSLGRLDWREKVVDMMVDNVYRQSIYEDGTWFTPNILSIVEGMKIIHEGWAMRHICDCGHFTDTGPGDWTCRWCGKPSNPVEETTSWTVSGANGKQYKYEGQRPEIGDKVKIVRPGRDVYVKVASVA